MERSRLLGKLARWSLTLLAVLPIAALLPGAFLDRGREGTLRVSLFPLALVVLDHLTWVHVRNSVLVASTTTVLAVGIGLVLAQVLAGWRFWGRSLGATLVCGTVVIPPLFTALGLRQLLLSARALLAAGDTWNAARWGVLVVSLLSVAVPLVVLSVKGALHRVDSGWELAAQALGENPRRIWWTITWPLIRPSVARSAATVFALSVFEPGAPLVLGLRRTLGFQIVDAAVHESVPGRAAILALVGCAITFTVRAALGWWGRGGSPWDKANGVSRARRASWPRALVFTLVWTIWVALAWLPWLGLVNLAAAGDGAGSLVADGTATTRGAGWHDLADFGRVLGFSVFLGAVVATLDAFLAWLWSVRQPGRYGNTTFWDRLDALPALAVAVGFVTLPWLLEGIGETLGGRGTGRVLASACFQAARMLDVYRTPGLALTLALVMLRLSFPVRVTRRARRSCRPVYVEAAITLGSPRRAALVSVVGRLAGLPIFRGWLLTAALAMTSVAPALVLAPRSDAQPFGPAVLDLANRPGAGSRAGTLALVGSCLSVLALAVAARGGLLELVHNRGFTD